jgi:hypothetical protein
MQFASLDPTRLAAALRADARRPSAIRLTPAPAPAPAMPQAPAMPKGVLPQRILPRSLDAAEKNPLVPEPEPTQGDGNGC